MRRFVALAFVLTGFGFAAFRLVPLAQQTLEERRPPPENRFQGGERRGPGPRGPGGGGPPTGVREPTRLVAKFDKNGDKWLNAAERAAAREYLEKEKAEGRGPRGPRFRGRNENDAPPAPGKKLSPAEVQNFPSASLYDPATLRTLFLKFETSDWEKELSVFYHTDVDLPAKLSVDGKDYPDVGVHFRGASSFFTVGPGRKHSLNISTDFIHKKQTLYSYRTLNLLNSHTDPTFLRSILYLQAARDYLPAAKANYVRLVINDENWGVYVNSQQFNKEFLQDWFGTTEGARWKVPGSPRARGGLEYLGEDPAEYQKIYDLKSKEDKNAWAALIRLCQVLNQTPPEKLEQELSPILDIDGALKFLALENALINSDGYWIRTSDYNLYLDPKGRFHIIPHDANETFREPEGPGWRGEGPGLELDPLRGADDPSRPLLNKLLAVPALKTKYLGHIRAIAEKWLDWKTIQPLAKQYQDLIAADVRSDTRKLYSDEAFTRGVNELKTFVENRRTFLLNHPALKP